MRCWQMKRKAICGSLTVVLAGFLIAPGCTLRIIEGGGGSDSAQDTGSHGGHAGAGGAMGQSGGGMGGSPEADEVKMGEEAYSQLDPTELRKASAKAGTTTCALAGAIEGLGLDPASLDEAALTSLMEEYLPAAEQQAQQWLSGEDPTMLAYTLKPKFECGEQGCAYTAKCKYGYMPEVNHLCFIDDCGPAKCRTCPDWVNDLLQNLAIKTWCSYVCVQTGTSPPKVVAVGAGGVSKLFDVFVGPICMK